MTVAQRSVEGLMTRLMRESSPHRRSRSFTHDHPEPMPERTTPTATALLVMDFQRGIADRYPGAVVEQAATAVGAARDAGIPVVFVRVAFRPGHPEISARNRTFAALREAGGLLEDESSVHPALAPRPDEPIVTKRRVSAFAGSDLDVVLRALGARTLVLSGIATSGVVLSTLRQAADLDFELTVLRDACADLDPEVHRVLLDKVFPRQADVIDVATWAAAVRERATTAY
jgi:nicotinamidase-related amidase